MYVYIYIYVWKANKTRINRRGWESMAVEGEYNQDKL